MKVWLVVATLVWTAVVGLGPASVCSLKHAPKLSYETVTFTTENADQNSYMQFIAALLDKLVTGDVRYAIPVLRESTTVPNSQRFVLVELSNWAGESITLAIDVTNLYVVGYRAGSRFHYFDDAPPAVSDLFPDIGTQSRSPIPFGGSYIELERAANADRSDIELGIISLEQAISQLHRTGEASIQRTTWARSLMICIQMVSEAVRFRYIAERVGRGLSSGYTPDPPMLSLENNWGALSSAVQQSSQGVFTRSVQLRRFNGQPVEVDQVRKIVTYLAIMLFVCRDQASSSDQFSPLIRSVVAADDGDTCGDPESTVRISGRNGLCVDVRDGQYNNGNPIQLWTCKENLDVNQLWTIKTDGTIRSNGKCLTTYGYAAGNYVMIFDCNSAVAAATRWEIWDNGTIINPQSALVLSAESGASGTTLTVETNIYASRQGWLPSNNSGPFVTSIVGFMDLCMQANGDNMWLVECESSKAEQQWAIYGDGSIRPQQNRDRCLTSNNHFEGTNIIIVSCSPGWASQRWVFTNDGTIFNLHNGMVMDVKESDPSLHQIIIWPFTGNPSQKWLPLL